MKNIVSPTIILKLYHSSFSHLHTTFLRSHLLLLHSAAGDEAYRRRNDGGPGFSSSPPSSFNSSSLSRRNYDEENRNVKITVWWDFENCNIPGGVNVHRVANRITWAIRSCGIKGPVTITAFGDVAQLSRATQEALASTGICLTHVPHSGKNSSDRFLMADIVYWVCQNPPPAHFFLISGDKDFANILHRLRMSNYNILLASTETTSGVLCSAATIMWSWNGLVKGENVTVRHFNHPPDGLYGSWYGHYKGLLDDPFADTDHPTTSQPEESMESISESKPRPVPRAVVNGIRQVLHSYPEGISLTELRSELKRNNITLDKDFYGHKKFSHFLASINLLKFIPPPFGDRQPLVVGTLKKGEEQLDIRPRSTKEIYTNGMYKDNGFTRKGDVPMEKTSISTEHPSSCKGNNLDANESASALSKGDHSVVDLEACKGASVPRRTILDPSATSQERDNMVAEEGFIEKLWKSLTGHRVGSVLKKDDNILKVDSSRHEDFSKNAPNVQSSDHSKQVKPKDEAVDPNNLFLRKENSEISSLDADKSITKDDHTGPSEKSNYAHEQRVGLFERIARWLKSRIYGANDQDDHSESGDKVHQTDAASISGKASPFSSTHAADHELFSRHHFWDELESFLLSPMGCHLILKSRTREQLLRRLQNEGPPSLKELDNNNLSHLGDILLLEKKWVEESASQKFPFRCVITAKKNSSMPQPSPLNGLSSLFPAKTISNSKKLQDQENEEHNLAAIEKKTVPPRRDEILSDCRKLVDELLQKNPTGFNISIFQPEFIKKYSYILDYQTLGYPKLVTLLQIMPGVRIEASYIRPKGAKEDVMNASKGEDDEGKQTLMENGQVDDSAWEELGPVANYTIHDNGKHNKTHKGATFSPVTLSDDEYTDSEEDVPLPSDRSGNCQQNLEDSSLLLRILDTWDRTKEGDGKEQLKDVNGVLDCSRNAYQKPSNTGAASLQKVNLRASSKRYSFVPQDASDDKELFAERILGEVKKAGDLRLKG